MAILSCMSARLPDWDDLEVFLATARQGTLAGASQQLGVNASTVQRRMNKLEDELRTRLFERSQRGYALTSAGEELYEHVLNMEREVLAVGRKIGGRDEALRGTVRVSTVDDLAVTVLPPLLRRFRARHPGVCLEMTVASEFLDLARRQADVAIRLGRKPTGPDIVAKHVARVGVGIYGSKAYFRKHPPPRKLPELARHELVMGTEAMGRLPMERVMREHGSPERVAYRSNSLLARLHAIRAGIGIGFVADFAAGADRSLTRLPFDLPETSGDMWMAIHVDLRRNARVRAFVDFVYEGLTSLRARFEG